MQLSNDFTIQNILLYIYAKFISYSFVKYVYLTYNFEKWIWIFKLFKSDHARLILT